MRAERRKCKPPAKEVRRVSSLEANDEGSAASREPRALGSKAVRAYFELKWMIRVAERNEGIGWKAKQLMADVGDISCFN